MVGRTQRGWARAAALGVLAAWLPCMPLGLCVRSAVAQPKAHGCCRQTAVKTAAAPQECWLQSPAPTPTGPPPPALAAPTALAVHTRPAAETGALHRSPHPTFSPLAIILRI